jgi:hypothetical protein
VVLCELCVHHTSLVDQFVPFLTTAAISNRTSSSASSAAAASSSSNILQSCHGIWFRRQALALFSNLLAEDFVKARDLLFPFLVLVADDDESLRACAESVFRRIVFARQPALPALVFAETICVLNGFRHHPNYTKVKVMMLIDFFLGRLWYIHASYVQSSPWIISE